MKYTLKEMCANVPYQDLSTHDIEQLWRRDFLVTYTTKELMEGRNPLSVQQLAALYTFNRDFMAITVTDRYNLFKECNDGIFHTTLLKMAQKYFDEIAPTFKEHASNSAYLSSVRIVNANTMKPTHNDGSLLILQFEAPINTIEDNMYSGNPNLLTVILPNTVVYVGSNAFADCPNLRDVYVNGDTSFEKSALPENAVVHKIGEGAPSTSGDDAVTEQLKAEIERLQESLATHSDKLNDTIAENTRLKDEVAAFDKYRDEAANEAVKLQDEIASLKSGSSEVTSLTTKCAQLELSLKEAVDTADRLTAEKAELMSDMSAKLQDAMETSDKIVEEKDAIISDLHKRIENLQATCINGEEEVTAVVTEDYHEQIDLLTEEKAELEEKYNYTSSELKSLRAEMSTLQDALIDASDLAKRYPLLSMLEYGDELIDNEDTAGIEAVYEDLCILHYKYGVTKVKAGKDLKEMIASYENGSASPLSEKSYIKAMQTLTEMHKQGMLSTRHLGAVKDFVDKVTVDCSYKEKILDIMDKHGYGYSEYERLYNECLQSLNPTLVKYTLDGDKDKLVADSMEEFLVSSSAGVNPTTVMTEVIKEDATMADVEEHIREVKGLGPDADISPYLTKLTNMANVLTETSTYPSREAALFAYVDRFL